MRYARWLFASALVLGALYFHNLLTGLLVGTVLGLISRVRRLEQQVDSIEPQPPSLRSPRPVESLN